MSKKPSGKSVQTKATEKARREALAVTQANIDKIDAGLAANPSDVDQPAPTPPAADDGGSRPSKVESAGEPARKRHVGPGGKRVAKTKSAKADKPKRLSALDAAAQVLGKSDKPMTSQALIDEMAAKGLWKSPGGATPSATLYAAMVREIGIKGKDARFRKVDRGLFAAA